MGEHILEPMFYDQDSLSSLPGKLINKTHCLQAGSWVEVGKWLIKEQNLHIIHQYTGKRNPLFLSP